MQNHVEEFRKDLERFREMTSKFYRGEVTVPEYKGFSGGFGSYAQRGGKQSMLRLGFTGGRITKEQLKFVADSIRKHQIGKVHITTGQNIQLHDLSEAQVCTLMEEALDAGIITRGGGGDYPRSIMATPLSGLVREPFDVLPYADEAMDYLRGFINTVKFPRKLKVCFENSSANETHATFRDMGFVAEEDKTFTVYVAGGLGNNPKMGVKVAQKVQPDQILYVLKTMVDIFVKYGNYENRGKARTRYLQDTLGAEELQRIFSETLEQNLAAGGLDLQVTEKAVTKSGSGEISDKRVIPQKQEGLYAVWYHPIGGCPEADFFGKLYDTVAEMDEIEVRLIPDEGLHVVNLTADEAVKVLAVTQDGAQTQFETSTSCIGASTCQVGIGKSQELLRACVDRIREEQFADGVLPAFHVSGCPGSCSAHQVGAIGFRGGMKPSEDGPKPAFAVFENGSERMGEERFGTDLGVMYADVIPEFFAELGRAVSAKGMDYRQFRSQCGDEFMAIVKKYV